MLVACLSGIEFYVVRRCPSHVYNIRFAYRFIKVLQYCEYTFSSLRYLRCLLCVGGGVVYFCLLASCKTIQTCMSHSGLGICECM